MHFALLAKIAARLGLKELSMGMSGDFEHAIAFGATYVRIGTAIFGARDARSKQSPNRRPAPQLRKQHHAGRVATARCSLPSAHSPGARDARRWRCPVPFTRGRSLWPSTSTRS